MPEKLPYLSDEHHYAIAAVATRAAQMEHLLEHTINLGLFGQSKLAEFLLKNMSQDRIVGLLEAVLSDQLQDSTGVAKLVGRIRKARDDRNEILHSIYGIADDPNLTSVATLRPYRTIKSQERSAGEFYAVAEELLAICLELTPINIVLARKFGRASAKDEVVFYPRADSTMQPSSET